MAHAAQQHAVGDICMIDPKLTGSPEDEPACPARVLSLSGDTARVSYYGWSAFWDADVPLKALCPPSADCARLMAEVDALEGMLLVPGTCHVRHSDDPAHELRRIEYGAGLKGVSMNRRNTSRRRGPFSRVSAARAMRAM